VATIGGGQVLDLVEVAECERGRYQAGDNVALWRSCESRRRAAGAIVNPCRSVACDQAATVSSRSAKKPFSSLAPERTGR
jgi:hypothetical protein